MRYLLVDGNQLAFRQRFAPIHQLATSDGRRSGVIYGLLRSIAYVQHRIAMQNYQTIVIWDGGRSVKRKEIYPEYKSGRVPENQTEEEKQEFLAFIQQLRTIPEVLGYLGIRSVRVNGCEADDLISIFAHFFVSQGAAVVIFSNDKDFCQLTSEHISLWHPDKELQTREDICNKWGVIEPSEIVTLRAIIGDKSDGIDGVAGLGEKRAAAVLDWIHEGSPEDTKSKHVQKYKESQEIVERNIRLMRLPKTWDESFYTVDQAIDATEQMLRTVKEDTRAYVEFCLRWELNSLLETSNGRS